jgi:hypothetical protein
MLRSESVGHCSVERLGKHNQTKSKITSSIFLTLHELPHSETKCLLAENIIVRSKLATVEWTFASAVHLPEAVVIRLNEANVVQVNLVVC